MARQRSLSNWDGEQRGQSGQLHQDGVDVRRRREEKKTSDQRAVD